MAVKTRKTKSSSTKRTRKNVRSQSKAKNKVKSASKVQRKRATPQRKKKSRVKQAAPKVKRSFQSALYGFYTISVIFALLLILSLAFLLYQWKDYKITELVKENQALQSEVLKLNSEVNRKQGTINTELKTYYRISQMASDQLALEPPAPNDVPLVLTVDKQKLEAYARKDRQTTKE